MRCLPEEKTSSTLFRTMVMRVPGCPHNVTRAGKFSCTGETRFEDGAGAGVQIYGVAKWGCRMQFQARPLH
eukprot:743493-Pelagomonas_calceolata.AAC.6